jgi:hypothetical protein
MADQELGFAGMLAAGVGPQAAWEQVRARAHDPGVQAIIAELRRTPQGQAALDYSRARWATHGLPPPWAPTTGEPEPPGDAEAGA